MRKVLALAFFAFLMGVAYWANTGSMPALLKAIYAFPNGDRIGHFVLYGLLAYLLTAAFPFWRCKALGWMVPGGALLALGLATLEEASQLFMAARTPDLVDLAAGYLGIFASTLIPCMGAACAPAPKGQT